MLLLLAALLLFAGMDSSIKYLSAHYSVPFIMAIRYIVHCLLMAAVMAPRHGMQMVRTHRTGLVLVRALCLAGVSLFFGLALQRMPVAETTAIMYLAPMLVVLVAGPLLDERIRVGGWAAAIIGFLGVMLIVRPHGGLDAVGIACVVLAIATNMGYQLLSRVLARTEHAVALVFQSALVGSICFGSALPWFWEEPQPSLLEALLFLGIGVAGGLGHFLFTLAYRHSPASQLAPIMYVQVLWAGLFGWLIFEHVPDMPSIIGMCVVVACGASVAWQARRAESGSEGIPVRPG